MKKQGLLHIQIHFNTNHPPRHSAGALKTRTMKNINVKFNVATNSNTYYATSLKAAASFCKKNDLVMIQDWDVNPSTTEKNAAVRCGWGVYCIPDNN